MIVGVLTTCHTDRSM